jgi:predicted RNA-binding Zn-ribbon protein involved in translation (DUF1610 family)
MIVRRNPDDPESCSNCGDKIGKLETPHLWQEHVVCERCHDKLSESAARKSVQIGYAASTLATAAPMTAAAVHRACPVCGSVRDPIRKAKGNGCVMLLLFLFFILPAIFYAIAYNGYIWVCPDCGAKLGDISE